MKIKYTITIDTDTPAGVEWSAHVEVDGRGLQDKSRARTLTAAERDAKTSLKTMRGIMFGG